jgi:phage head maturation protease
MVIKKTGIKAKKTTTKCSTKKTTSKKGAFGGYKVNFNGRQETLENVFGKSPLAPSAMTKKLWNYVKAKKLADY